MLPYHSQSWNRAVDGAKAACGEDRAAEPRGLTNELDRDFLSVRAVPLYWCSAIRPLFRPPIAGAATGRFHLSEVRLELLAPRRRGPGDCRDTGRRNVQSKRCPERPGFDNGDGFL